MDPPSLAEEDDNRRSLEPEGSIDASVLYEVIHTKGRVFCEDRSRPGTAGLCLTALSRKRKVQSNLTQLTYRSLELFWPLAVTTTQ